MKLLVLALLASAAAVAVAPPTPSKPPLFAEAWPAPVVRAADLGRVYAAADVGWLKTVQVMGSPMAMEQHYPHLEDWVDLDTSLDPKLGIAYSFGAILLVTEADRADKLDALLARGESAMPEDYSMPMSRGFVAYFGRLDAGAAADHYARAATKPGAPPYLAAFADRLKRESAECSVVFQHLKEQVAASTSKQQSDFIASQAGNIVEKCWKKTIEQAAHAFVTRGTSATSVAQLVDAGLIHDVWQPRGRCWHLQNEHASLVPCEGQR